MTGKKIRTVSMLLTLALASSALLAACSSSTTKTDQASAGLPKPEEKKYQITWTANQLGPIDKDAEMIKYWNEKFNVDIKVVDIESNKYTESLNLKFASNDIPDKIHIQNFGDLQKYADQSVLAEIPLDLVKKNAPHLYEAMVKEKSDVFKYGQVNGKLYAIPGMRIENTYRTPIVYRGDWMKKLGVTKAPETLEELEKLLYRFTNEDPDGNGKKDTYGLSKEGFKGIYGAFGYGQVNWSARDGKLVYGAVQPEMKQALTYLNKWYKDGVIDPEFITGENKGGYWAISHAYMNGRIGLTSLGNYYHWYANSVGTAQEMKKAGMDIDNIITFGEPVKGPAGKSGIPQNNVMSTSLLGFGKQLEKDQAKFAKILTILDYFYASEDNYLTAYMGIKGKDWEMDKSGNPVFLNGIGEKEISSKGGHLIMASVEVPQFTSKVNGSDLDAFAKKNKFDKNGIIDQLLTSLPSESKYKAELKKIEDEAYIKIITGEKPVSYFDEFVDKWRKSGGDQLEKEATEWYATIK